MRSRIGIMTGGLFSLTSASDVADAPQPYVNDIPGTLCQSASHPDFSDGMLDVSFKWSSTMSEIVSLARLMFTVVLNGNSPRL